MAKIELSQGKYAIVDDDKYKWLLRWKWFAVRIRKSHNFYAYGKRKVGDVWWDFSMARILLGLKKGDNRQVDHINHATLDNRMSNLRIVTNQQNHFNESSPKGYYWDRVNKKYRAQIMLNGKQIALGRYLLAEDARKAYLEAKKLYHRI